MARITVEDCLEQVGDDNRFALVHLTVERIRQHREGEPYHLKGKNKEIVMTLREIAAGTVTFENINELPKLRKAKMKAQTEEIQAAADSSGDEE